MAQPTLEQFIQQLYAGATNPATAWYLPLVVLEQTLPADPLTVGDYDWGDLATLDPSLPSALCAAITNNDISTPGATGDLQLTHLQLIGLSTAVPGQPTVNNDQVSVTFDFGAGTQIAGGISTPRTFHLAGDFQIGLSCCRSQDGTTCSGKSHPRPVGGHVRFTFEGASLSLGLTVSSAFAVTVTSATFAASSVETVFIVIEPALASGALETQLDAAFTTAQAATAIYAAINQSLSSSAFLTALGNVLSQAFPSLAEPPLLSFAVSLLYEAGTDPSSSDYLPTLLAEQTNPSLDPYVVSGTWDLGDVSSFFPTGGTTICGVIGATQGQFDICTPGSPVDLQLTNIQITGLASALPQPPLIVGNDVIGIAGFGAVTVSGDFALSVSCCQSTDAQTCASASQLYTGNGTFSAELPSSSVATDIAISVNSSQELVATVNQLYFRGDPKDIEWTILITSVPANQQEAWNNYAEELFNTEQAGTEIIGQIQKQMSQPSLLASLSQMITGALQSVMNGDPSLAARLAVLPAAHQQPQPEIRP